MPQARESTGSPSLIARPTPSPVIRLVSSDKPLDAPYGGGLQALCIVAQRHGIAANPPQIAHDLAFRGTALTGHDLIRAAKAIGLRARLVQGPTVERLRSAPAPALLRLKSGDWAILGAEAEPGHLLLVDPVTQRKEVLPAAEILDRAGGDLIVVKKVAAPVEREGGRSAGWFLQSLARYTAALTHVVVASCFVQLFAIATPLVFQLVIDKVLVHKTYSTLVVLAVALVALAFFGAVLKYLRTYALYHTGSRIDVELGARLVAHLLRLPIAYFETRSAGTTLTRVRELETVRSFFTGQGVLSLIDAAFMLISFAVLFLYSVKLGAIVAAVSPVYLLIALKIRPGLKAKLNEKFARWSHSQQFIIESLVGIQTLKAAAVEPLIQKEWESRFSEYVKAGFEANLMGAKGQTAVEFTTKLSTALILFFGAEEVIGGRMTVGSLIAFNMIAGQTTQPIIKLAQLWQDFQQVQVSMNRIGDVFAEDIEMKSNAMSIVARPRGAIEIRDVTFRYKPDRPPVLRGVSLAVEPGELIGIVGSSGSGKSTLTKLMQRFYAPNRGKILLDGIDLSTLDVAWLRRQFGVVLQDSTLFNRTIHDNIALARPEMSRQEVMRLARLSGADEFIGELPEGYDTPIEERGANLSGGQRQRIGIARALATDPRVLIFDEATSALDYESERIIQANMREIAKGRTVIVIAHRLAAVRDCDRIVGMKRGEVVEVGSHDALLAREGGVYAHLWSLQASQAG